VQPLGLLAAFREKDSDDVRTDGPQGALPLAETPNCCVPWVSSAYRANLSIPVVKTSVRPSLATLKAQR
jgi:hypothetical protein